MYVVIISDLAGNRIAEVITKGPFDMEIVGDAGIFEACGNWGKLKTRKPMKHETPFYRPTWSGDEPEDRTAVGLESRSGHRKEKPNRGGDDETDIS